MYRRAFLRQDVVSRLFRLLLIVEFIILIADIAFHYFELFPIRELKSSFDITSENSFCNWLTATLTFLIGVAIFLVSYAANKNKLLWKLSGICFFIWGLDDATRFHERLGKALYKIAFRQESMHMLAPFPSHVWQLVLGPIYILMGLGTWYFLIKNMNLRSHKVKISIGFLTLAFCFALDFYEGLNLLYPVDVHFIRSIEEFLELFAMGFLFTVFIDFLLMIYSEIHLKFTS